MCIRDSNGTGGGSPGTGDRSCPGDSEISNSSSNKTEIIDNNNNESSHLGGEEQGAGGGGLEEGEWESEWVEVGPRPREKKKETP